MSITSIKYTPPSHVLPVIVISQFFCTSLWFAGNGVMSSLVSTFNLTEGAIADLSSAVQFGFIAGTLVFALLSIADRYSPSIVFLTSAIFGALANLGLIWNGNTLLSMLIFRFFTGFFLAGIYPVGMKIATDYYHKRLGKSLGFLVGALVLGTALPHLLKDLAASLPWKAVIQTTSLLTILGGLLMGFSVDDGPFRKASTKLDLSASIRVFKNVRFRRAAFGYFGHMWELYTFWVFVPILLQTYIELNPATEWNIPLLSFLIIAVGGPACVFGGYVSLKWGVKRTAMIALALSAICCLVSVVLFELASPGVFLIFLVFWGMVVILDSPLFSTLVAKNAPIELKGTALTMVNCIGFSITIISIQLFGSLQKSINPTVIYTLLAIGPILGLLALRKK